MPKKDWPGLFLVDWSGSADPGFDIAASEVDTVRDSLAGVPVSIEHAGLQKALKNLESSPLDKNTFSDQISKFSGVQRQVGHSPQGIRVALSLHRGR